MKKIILATLLLFFLNTYAQRNAERTYIGFLTGYEKNGWVYELHGEYNNYNNGLYRLSLGIEPEKYKFRNEKVPVMLYLGSINYLHNVLYRGRNDTFIFRVGGGIIGGWEQVNKGKKYLKEGYELTQKSKAIYGLNLLAEAEFYLFDLGHSTQEVWLILQGNYHYFINSDVGNIQPILKAGLKIDLGL